VHNLSFGQKKRVCIAGVLAMEPQLLILDEPMAGLDHAMRQDLLAVFDHLHAQGITLLLATHDIDFAYRWADRIHLMARGRCTGAFDAGLPGERWRACAAGLPCPAVIELHRQLVAAGHLQAGQSPRSIGELPNCYQTSRKEPAMKRRLRAFPSTHGVVADH
jgi:cobalt/nickel transport system ATP-binding protein